MDCNYQKRLQILDSSLAIANVELTDNKTSTVEVKRSVNHIFCVDVSGSMYSTLPLIRNQLKNKLPDLVGDGNTITIIWFSGAKECGILKEFVNIKNAKDLQMMNEAIDKFLRPMGLTSFYEPVELATRLVTTSQSLAFMKNKSIFNFIFMSDGGNNDHPWTEVVEMVENLSGRVAGCTIIEYGNWADSEKLQQMAEILGGQKIYAEDFESYEFTFEKAMKSDSMTPKVEVDISDFKSTMNTQTIIEINDESKSVNIYDAQRSTSVYLPMGTKKFFYIQKMKGVGAGQISQEKTPELYAAMWVALSKGQTTLFEKLLKDSGDIRFINSYEAAFGKQRLEALKSDILDAVFDPSLRCSDGVDYNYKAKSNGYCILDLMDDLSQDETNEILVCDPRFSYKRIGAKSRAKIVLDEETKEALSNASTKLKADKILSEVERTQKVNVIYPDADFGSSIRNLVWSEDRANLSFMVKIPVTLELPENEYGITSVDSYIFRNFTIIKDGILNINQIPMHLSEDMSKKLSKRGLISEAESSKSRTTEVVDLSRMPIINRDRIKRVRMDTLAGLEVDLLKFRAYKKYLGWLKKSDAYLGTGFNYVDSPESEYLRTLGITQTGGYTPASEMEYSGDYYMAPTLKSTISKFSSLPKIEEVIDKVKLNKSLTVSQEYMNDVINDIDNLINNSEKSPYDEINELYDLYDSYAKGKIRALAQSKFCLIMSKKWFSDKTGFDDNTMKVKVGDAEQTIKFEFRDQKIPM